MSRLGLQLASWRPAGELVEIASGVSGSFDIVWLVDQMLSRNVYVTLAALAARGNIGVGTNVTWPIGRNPLEMAASLATLRELVPPDKSVVAGIGTGGALVASLFKRERMVGRVSEAIELMRRLFAGESAALSDFPLTHASSDFLDEAVAKLTFPVEHPLEIVVAGVGPKILELAGRVADGLIAPSNLPGLSLAAFRAGKFEALAKLDRLEAGRAKSTIDDGDFKMIYGINCSISNDRVQAKQYARRQLALIVGNANLWPALEAVGLDVASARDVKKAFDDGGGIDAACKRLSDSLSDGLIISGTPDECIPPMLELKKYAAAAGFNEFYLGAPLGPDLREACELLARRVVPEVWPEGR